MSVSGATDIRLAQKHREGAPVCGLRAQPAAARDPQGAQKARPGPPSLSDQLQALTGSCPVGRGPQAPAGLPSLHGRGVRRELCAGSQAGVRGCPLLPLPARGPKPWLKRTGQLLCMVTGSPKSVSEEPNEDTQAGSLGSGCICGQIPSWDPPPSNQALLPFPASGVGS